MQTHKASVITTIILLICLVTRVSSIDTLKQGDSLNSSSQLVSSKRIFTLGFFTPQDTTNTYLAIWYTDDSSNPVWIGNRENPVPNSNTDHILTVSTAGQVMITHSGGESIQLYSGEAGNNLSAALLDSGNFVVKDMRNQLLWQSFDYPTDTLLPGMKLGINHRTGRNWLLSSWFGRTNPAPGAFTLEWDHVVGRLLIRRRGVVYWSSSHLKNYYDQNLGNVKQFRRMNFNLDAFTWNYNFTNSTSANENYFMYSLIQVPNLTPDDRKVISGWKLEYQGDITEKGNRPVMVMASLCYIYTTKGPNAYPGCILWGCRTNREKFVLRTGSFKPVNGNPALPVYDNSPSLSESDCREMCWTQCECAGYKQAVGGDGCVYWSGRDLEFVQSLDASANQIYVLQSASSSKGMKRHVKIILVVVSTVLLLILVVVFFVVRKIKQGKMEEKLHELLRLEGYTENYDLKNGGAKNHDLRLFTYSSIQSATSNFSLENKLGEGGFGMVYKGKTPEGQDIAVKLLSRQSGQGLLEFKTELVLISKLQHVNLVKLLGFCVHGDDKMIIYDYMPNKSLDFFLFSPSKREHLDWEKRFKIIEGIAQGLLYLHKHSRLRVIHRDMKPSNILLDENMIPKISDFGLARIFKENASESNTNRRVGTYGYIAPEYAMQGIFSVKSDVYSFGVLVLEIVSGRKNSSFDHTEGPLHLVEYAWELWRKDSALDLMDPTLRASCVLDQLQRCVHIGLLCVENHAADRPTSEDVIMMLKNETTSLPMPKNPSYIARDIVLEEKEKRSMPQKFSANQLSLTEIRGR